jgi:hypothetical protein
MHHVLVVVQILSAQVVSQVSSSINAQVLTVFVGIVSQIVPDAQDQLNALSVDAVTTWLE